MGEMHGARHREKSQSSHVHSERVTLPSQLHPLSRKLSEPPSFWVFMEASILKHD